MPAPRKRVVIIGAGIVGMATGFRLQQARPDLHVTILEKEPGPGRHQSTHNSGVLHAGLYYKPGSQKAQLAVSGLRAMVAFCREHGIAHEVCGKLVVAVDKSEVTRLEALFERGKQNGLAGLQWLEGDEVREVEPYAAGVAAVRVPEEGIVDYAQVCRVLADLIVRNGGALVSNAEAETIERRNGTWLTRTTAGGFEADYLITCGGLHADRLMRMAGETCNVRIVPFRGEYYVLRSDRAHLVRNLIYPVPDPRFPFLGVHFTRRINGGVEAGPNAVLAFAREGYTRWRINPRDFSEAILFPGLWRFLLKHRTAAWDEFTRSMSREQFAASLRRLVPEISQDDLSSGGAGVRAQAMRADGTLVEDFEIAERHRALHVLNSPSPAATASLAIGEALANRAIASLEN